MSKRPPWMTVPAGDDSRDRELRELLFFRPKDIVDVSRMLELAAEDFDHAFVRDSPVDIAGEDDERVAKWDSLQGG